MSTVAGEICAGGGRQALGLEQAGFEPLALAKKVPLTMARLYNREPDGVPTKLPSAPKNILDVVNRL